MSEIIFTRAVKYESKLKIALESESGAGKTLTALILASRIAKHRGGRIALADSEHKSALLYADLVDFDHFPMPDHKIDTYLDVMDAAERMRYSVLVLDSTSHLWNGKGGALEEVDAYADNNRTQRGGKNSYGAWKETRPKLNKFNDRINDLDIDLICTFRQKKKTSQVTQPDGTSKIETVGLELIGPNDIEYEFTLLADLVKSSNALIVTKTRCPRLKEKIFHALGSVEPIDLDKEPKTATHGMVDDLIEWLKGAPPPKPIPKEASGATKAYLELHDQFLKLDLGELWDELMEKYHLAWNFTAMQMEDPAIAERSRTVFQLLRNLLKTKQLEASLTLPKPNGEPAPPVSQAAPAPETQTNTVPVQTVPEPTPDPAKPTDEAPAPVTLALTDFTKSELDTLFKAAKATRAKGYNRANFLDELQTFAGTRDDFMVAIMNPTTDEEGVTA